MATENRLSLLLHRSHAKNGAHDYDYILNLASGQCDTMFAMEMWSHHCARQDS
jgi:hypothetical protein